LAAARASPADPLKKLVDACTLFLKNMHLCHALIQSSKGDKSKNDTAQARSVYPQNLLMRCAAPGRESWVRFFVFGKTFENRHCFASILAKEMKNYTFVTAASNKACNAKYQPNSA
jgi:hypothetical protein